MKFTEKVKANLWCLIMAISDMLIVVSALISFTALSKRLVIIAAGIMFLGLLLLLIKTGDN